VAWGIATVLPQAPRRSSTGPVRFRPNRGRAGCEQRETHAHRRGDHRGIHPTHQPWPPPVAGRRRRGRPYGLDGGHRRGHAAGPDGSASPDGGCDCNGGCDCDGGSPAGCQSQPRPQGQQPGPRVPAGAGPLHYCGHPTPPGRYRTPRHRPHGNQRPRPDRGRVHRRSRRVARVPARPERSVHQDRRAGRQGHQRHQDQQPRPDRRRLQRHQPRPG
jgi:hypothetical protein